MNAYFEKSFNYCLISKDFRTAAALDKPMLLTFFLLLLVTAGGTALTFLFEKEESLMARICLGHVVGSALFGTSAFALALVFRDLTTLNSAIALGVGTLPVMLFKWERFRVPLKREWKHAVTATQGFTAGRFLRLAYYALFLLLFLFYFDRAMIVKPDGIFTGASQNYGDLPAHLGAIYAFVEGGVFPPENPSYAFAKFTYPFLVDLISAAMVKLEAGVRDAMFVQNVALALCLLVLLERFISRLTSDSTVAKIGAVLFFFSGGLGFISFASQTLDSSVGLWHSIWNIGQDFTIGKNYRWGNPMVVLLITQRSFLLGMPLTLMALTKVWEIFSKKTEEIRSGTDWAGLSVPFAAGLATGTLPLIHIHSLAAVFIVCAVLFLFDIRAKWKLWIAFAFGVSVPAIPELLWIMTGSASNFTKFIEWQTGWEHEEYKDLGLVLFWLKNTGIVLPMTVAGLLMHYLAAKRRPSEESEHAQSSNLLVFYVPFVLIFLVANWVKLAPWGWDNVKVLIYWFIASLPFMALVIARAWRRDAVYKSLAVCALLVLSLSGALDIWRVASKQIEFNLFDKDGVAIGRDIILRTPRDALFLNAQIHNPPVLLSGRRSLMRSPGHLFSYGIDATERDNDTKLIYSGSQKADALLAKYEIDYVMVGPQEKIVLKNVNDAYFRKFTLIAERGEYKVYKVR